MLPRARQFLFWCAFIGLACRALVPVGFMPASLADGGPIRVCHGGAAGAFFRALEQQPPHLAQHHAGHGLDHDSTHVAASHDPTHVPAGHELGGDATRAHAGHDLATVSLNGESEHYGHATDYDDHATDHAVWESCSVGASFALAALISESPLVFPPLESAADWPEPAVPAAQPVAVRYRARAPPVI